MSSSPLGNCPDCGQEYRDPHEVLPTPEPTSLSATSMSWAEYAAQTHQDVECPIAKERELLAGLEAALRYFGMADTMAALVVIMRRDEHDAQVIWGNLDRWFSTREGERLAARPINCKGCGVELGVVRGSRFEFGSASIGLADLDGSEEITCRGCNTSRNVKAAVSPPVDVKPHGLTLVQPQPEEPGQRSGGIGGGGSAAANERTED